MLGCLADLRSQRNRTVGKRRTSRNDRDNRYVTRTRNDRKVRTTVLREAWEGRACTEVSCAGCAQDVSCLVALDNITIVDL